MSLDEGNSVVKLPSAFQSLSTPTSSTIKKTIALNPSTTNHLCGYRSNFNVNEEKAKYEQQKQQQQQTSPEPQPPSFDAPDQPHKSHNKPRNDNHQPRNQQFSADSGGGWCETCDRSFKSQQQLDRHLGEHEKCCFDGCKYEAHSTLLKKHIETQHNSGIFERIERVETEEDIEKWREERRKRYPTKANIEARQLAQEQRLKRGERIREPNNRFGKNCDRRRAQEGQGKLESNDKHKAMTKNKKKRQRKRRNDNKTTSRVEAKIEPENNAENPTDEVVRFAGISYMIEATETSDLSLEPEMKINSLTALMNLYGNDTSDDSDEGPDEVSIVKCNDKDGEVPSSQLKEVDQTPQAVLEPVENEAHEIVHEENVDPSKTENSDNDEPPDEESIAHEPSEEFNASVENENDRKRPNELSSRREEPKRKIPKRQSILDMTKKIRNQNSLLEKLLQKDIRHERNVLLQCVRYVVENDFFGVGRPAKKE